MEPKGGAMELHVLASVHLHSGDTSKLQEI
jgi:hypothetical protein